MRTGRRKKDKEDITQEKEREEWEGNEEEEEKEVAVEGEEERREEGCLVGSRGAGEGVTGGWRVYR